MQTQSVKKSGSKIVNSIWMGIIEFGEFLGEQLYRNMIKLKWQSWYFFINGLSK